MTTTKIEWTHGPNGEKGEVWNPVRGCSRISAGCENCYAERMAHRFSGPGQPYEGLTTLRNGRTGWTGSVQFVPEMLDVPLRWRKPRMVFVNSMSDLFHERVSDEQIAAVFGVIAACPQHTFQVLTKRPERMRDLLFTETFEELVVDAGEKLAAERQWCHAHEGEHWPIQNLWLGVSVENQAAADERIPLLLQTPTAVRWVSAEPLLGEVDLRNESSAGGDHDWLTGERYEWSDGTPGPMPRGPRLGWVVVGAESGPGARPMDENWVRSIREQCIAAGVPFFFKQRLENGRKVSLPRLDGMQWALFPKVTQ